jgi:prolyl-tRNA editing enzyme YbaK/EbsC (Cys-tRNA(Pro) deacylase)
MPAARATERVQSALDAAGIEARIIELAASARTAAEAAAAVGCSVAQIAKSLVFRGAASGDAILVIASGTNRVNEKKIAEHAGEAIAKADADFVRERTGYAIGGIPPAGHASPLRTFIDRDLLQYDRIWAAAGTPHAVMELTPAQLTNLVPAPVVEIQ